MGFGRTWTKEDEEYLQDNWGSVSIAGIAKYLGRSLNAVKLKAQKSGLSDARMNFDGITLNQLALALDKTFTSVKSWIETYGMPVKKKLFCKEARVMVIGYSDFWKWAEQHKEVINLAKMEENMIGPEPKWAKVKRNADKLRSQKTWQSVKWTIAEDQILAQLVRLQDTTYSYLANHFNRSESSIKRRLYDLNINFRPVSLDKHVRYTTTEVQQLMEMAQAGYGYETIAQRIGKGALGVRGKLERMKFDFKRRRFPEVTHEQQA
jgi:hypothetical protein